MAVEAGDIKRLIVTMPPQHGKSELTSWHFPAWMLGHHPDWPIILASYEQDFASQWGGRARDTFDEFAPELWGLTTRQDSSSKSRWEVYGHMGGMRSVGAAGSITGKSARLFLIDDPFKGPDDARNTERQEAVMEWYRTVVYTRLHPMGALILIQTRWDEGDLAGRLLADSESGEGDYFHHVNLPAIAMEPDPDQGVPEDPMGRLPGVALWRERYDEEYLKRVERLEGPYNWASLYQQRPIPLEGGLFKRQWLRRYRVIQIGSEVMLELERRDANGQALPVERVSIRACTRFITVDLAASTKETADYTVIAVWYMTPAKDLCLMDLVRVRAEGPDQLTLIQDAHTRYQPSFIGVESVAYQLTAVQTLHRRGLPIRELKPDKDKRARAMVPAARMAAGALLIPYPGSPQAGDWLEAYEREIFRFRGTAKGKQKEQDDQVDVTSYAAEIAAMEEVASTGMPIPVGMGGGSHWRSVG